MERKNVRRIIVFVVLFVAVSLFGLIARRWVSLSKPLAGYLETQLEKSLGKDVSVGKVGTNFINHIALHNVAIASGESIREGTFLVCEKVTINYNLVKVIFKKRPLWESISRITLKSPNFQVTWKEGSCVGLGKSFSDTILGMSFPDIVVVNGSLLLDRGEGRSRIELKKVSGILTCQGKTENSLQIRDRRRINFQFRGRSNFSKSGRVILKGSYLPVTEKLNFSLEALGFDMAACANVVGPPADFRVSGGAGDLFLALTITLGKEGYSYTTRLRDVFQGKCAPEPKFFSYSGRLILRDSSFSWKSHAFSKVNGKIIFDNERIGTEELSVRYKGIPIKVKGGIEKYFSAGAIGFNILGEFPFGALQELSPESRIDALQPLQGLVKVSVDIQGTLRRPRWEGWFKLVEGRVKDHKLEEFQGEFSSEAEVIKLTNVQGKLGQSTFILGGNVDVAHASVALYFTVTDLILGNFLDKDWTNRINGQASVNGTVSGSFRQLCAKGEIKITDFKLARKEVGNFAGIFTYRNRELVVTGSLKDYSVDLLLGLNGPTIVVSKLEILANEEVRVGLVGSVLLGEKEAIDLKILNSYVSMSRIPLRPRLKNMGRIDFEGTVTGAVKSPRATLTIWSRQLRVGEEDLDFSCKAYYEDNVLYLDALRLSTFVSGKMAIDFGNKWSMTGSVEAEKADLAKIYSLFTGEVQKRIKGIVSGKIDFANVYPGDFPGEKSNAKGRISLTSLQIGNSSADNFSLDFIVANQEVKLDGIRLLKGKGQMTGSGTFAFREQKTSRILIETQWKDYPLGVVSSGRPVLFGTSLVFVGTLTKDKDWRITGSIAGKQLTCNGEQLGPIEGSLSLDRRDLQLSVCCGMSLKGNLRVELGSKKKTIGEIEVRRMDIGQLLRIVLANPGPFITHTKGKLDGKISLSGVTRGLELGSYLVVREGSIYSTNFSSDINISYSNKDLIISSLQVKIPPGELKANGAVHLGQTEPLAIDVSLERLSLGVVKFFFPERDWDLSGDITGTIQLRGSLRDPRIKTQCVFEGLWMNGLKAEKIETLFKTRKDQKKIEWLFETFSLERKGTIIRLVPQSIVSYSLDKKLVEFSGVTEIRNLNVAGVSLFGDANLDGFVDVAGKTPSAEIIVEAKDFWLNRHCFGRGKIKLFYKDGTLLALPVRGQDFQVLGEAGLRERGTLEVKLLEVLQNEQRLLSVSGSIGPSGKMNLFMEGTKGMVDMRAMGELLNIKTSIEGMGGFRLRLVKNPLEKSIGKPSLFIQTEGEIEIANGRLSVLPFDAFVTSFSGNGRVLSIKRGLITKKDEYNITCSGTIPYGQLTDEIVPVDLLLEIADKKGRTLGVLTKEIRDAKGEVEGRLHITGTRKEPLINGFLHVEEGTLYGREVFKKIEDLFCNISVKDNNVYIEGIEARMDKAKIDMKGRVKLLGWMPDTFDVTFENRSGNGIPLKIPFLKIPRSSFFGGLVSEVPASLELMGKIRAYGTVHSYKLVGKVKLQNTFFTYPPRREDTESLRLDFLNPAIWDLEIEAGKNTWYQNKFANVQVEGKMKLTGITKDLTVNGTISSHKGELSYLGANFIVRQATVECINDELFLEARAECPVEGDTILLVVERGKWGKVKPRFSSLNDPQMTEQEALAKATGVDSLKFSTEEGSVLLRRELLRLIDSSLASPLISSILRSTGLVDLVKVDTISTRRVVEKSAPEEQMKENGAKKLWEGTEITFGKYLSPDLYLGYKLLFDEGPVNKLELHHEVEVLYRIKKGISLRGRVGEQERYLGVERQIRF